MNGQTKKETAMRGGCRRFEGRVAIVTGAASGIGSAVVERLAGEGAKVVAVDIDDAHGPEIAHAHGARFHHMDTGDREGWEQLVAHVGKDFGRLDILVNNAAVLSGKTLDSVDPASFAAAMRVNVEGPLWGSQCAMRLLRGNTGGPGGSIVNTASTASFGAIPDDLPYSVTKAALAMLTRCIAVWCAREGLNIRCNAVHPGSTRTGIHEEILAASDDPDAILAGFAAMSPLGRMAKPDEIAAVVAFLASEDASYVTGASYLADGGMLALHPGT